MQYDPKSDRRTNRDRPKPQNSNLTLLWEPFREEFPPDRKPGAHGGTPHRIDRGPKVGRAILTDRTGDFLPLRSADQAAILLALALALASPITVAISSWSRLQNR
jgi:hypothetical protein